MTPAKQLDTFLAKYDPTIARQAKAILAKLRKLVPGAIELVYDNYNALAIGFGPSDKSSLAVISIALYPRHINFFFLQGKGLPDPAKRLQGHGNQVRYVTLTTPAVLDEPEIRQLLQIALQRAKVSIDPIQKRVLIIKSISKKQRPRRPNFRANAIQT
jgi:hypothetical protein